MCQPQQPYKPAEDNLGAVEVIPEPAPISLRGVTVQLDIRFWRGRLFWAVKAAVRFFRP